MKPKTTRNLAQFFAPFSKAFLMSVNLIQTVQQNLQYPPLEKIDPNTQELHDKNGHFPVNLVAQAGIPAVLTAIYRLSRNDAGSKAVISAGENADTMSILFDGKDHVVIEKIALYAGVSVNQAESHLENIADESVRLVRTVADDPVKLKHFMNGQRHNILVHLPAALSLGDLLKDESLDDKTNKMEGPVSSFMHRIENVLSQGGN